MYLYFALKKHTNFKMPKYIVVEGLDGMGKTTQVRNLVEYLRGIGKTVLVTKEPGTVNIPLTMKLRELMLDNQYDDQQTVASRELISQAIRSIHMEKLIYPAQKPDSQYDFIVQDRGTLSGFAYGIACGNHFTFIQSIVSDIVVDYRNMYDLIIYLKGNIAEGLQRAASRKKEFESGDAIEKRDIAFFEKVAVEMDYYVCLFDHVVEIQIDGKTADEVFAEIKNILPTNFLK